MSMSLYKHTCVWVVEKLLANNTFTIGNALYTLFSISFFKLLVVLHQIYYITSLLYYALMTATHGLKNTNLDAF